MDKWIIIETDALIDRFKAGYTSVDLVNGQSILRVDTKNEKYFTAYKKYDADEMAVIDVESIFKHKSLGEMVHTNAPFKNKHHEDGSKLYENCHGTKTMIAGGATETLRIKVPYDKCFFTEAEIINAYPCSTATFKFEVDDGAGGYVNVHQHGHTVNIAPNLYRRKSSYEAQLTNTIYIAATITNSDPNERCYGLNIVLHEAK